MNSRCQLIASIAGNALLSIQQTSLPQNAHEQIDRDRYLLAVSTVTLIVVTSGGGKRLNPIGQSFALAAAYGSRLG
ncbi:MAG TPA: hypothetical protein VF353_13210 [Candidatus Binatia bacterium]